MGPKDWTKIERSGIPYTDPSFPADESMLRWKEYPRTVGGLAKYLTWFKTRRIHMLEFLCLEKNLKKLVSLQLMI